MQDNRKDRSGLGVRVGFCALATLAGLEIPAANAQDASATGVVSAKPQKQTPPARKRKPSSRPETAQKPAGQYLVEFRSRYALSYGHTFVAHGRLNARGEIVESHIAGLHPKGDTSAPWMIGHIVPVPSETGASDGDLEEQYISARYRVVLNESEYNKIAGYIRHLQASSPLWHAAIYNCNAFGADVARFMGLRAPFHWLPPQTFINSLREMNGGQQHAAPTAPLPTAPEPAAPMAPRPAAPSDPFELHAQAK